ncbi:MAG: GNAT family N-acetyltransferase [Bacteroidales bacterium]|nr:GNAT family N-acetyltransferase [Bacteroidales bacterium]
MNRRDEIKKIWRECFDDSQEYVDMYFDRVYREQDAMTLEDNGRTVSSLLLQHYDLHFHGRDVGMAYIAGAATRRGQRGKGYMAELLAHSLRESRQRGDMLCALIPAHDWLYYYYADKGFSTVFYVDPQRYTSLHTFPTQREYAMSDDPYGQAVFDAFHRMELDLPCCVMHSHRDFLNILDDLAMDGGHFVAMYPEGEAERIVSMAWASVVDGVVVVKRVLGDDGDARTGALRCLRGFYPELPFKVLVPPLSQHRKLYPRGMARIVNAELCLRTVAESHPKLKLAIRVHDDAIPENAHTFIIANGTLEIRDDYHDTFDFDVDHKVLADIVFSSPEIGSIIGFPSVRPIMSLMLD